MGFSAQRRGAELEAELGRVFRTERFNIARRRQQARVSGRAETLPIRELYRLRHEGDPTLNARLLSDLHPRRQASGVQKASVDCSPCMSGLLVAALGISIGSSHRCQ